MIHKTADNYSPQLPQVLKSFKQQRENIDHLFDYVVGLPTWVPRAGESAGHVPTHFPALRLAATCPSAALKKIGRKHTAQAV